MYIPKKGPWFVNKHIYFIKEWIGFLISIVIYIFGIYILILYKYKLTQEVKAYLDDKLDIFKHSLNS